MAPKPVAKAAGAAAKKVGPLPVWAWALIVGGGGLLAFLYFRRNSEQLDGSGGGIHLVSGNRGTPEQAASGGYPQGVTPAAQMLDQEVLWTIAGSLAEIADDGRERGLSLGDQIAGVKDHVSSTVAAATLGTGIATPTAAAVAPVPAKQPAPSRYYTYLPGKAPKGRKKDEAPKGKRLGYRKNKGY